MPLEKLALILVCVVAAAGGTIWLATVIGSTLDAPFGWQALIPAVLIGGIALRIIAGRAQKAGNGDRMDH